MRILTLVENLVYKPGLKSEHGLSILVQTKDATVLFDTGQSDLFCHNAKAMDIDLTDVNSLVLSHGHFDHAGGIRAFCDLNKTAPIYTGKGFFAARYDRKTNFYIGTELEPKNSNRCIVIEGRKEIAPSIFVMGSVPIRNALDTHFENLVIERDGHLCEDTCEEEQSLCIVDRGGLIVLSGCSHRGITNIIQHAQEEFDLPIRLIIGGFHMKDEPANKTNDIVSFLAASGIKAMGVCHCTGVEKLSLMQSACGAGVFYNFTGTDIKDEYLDRL